MSPVVQQLERTAIVSNFPPRTTSVVSAHSMPGPPTPHSNMASPQAAPGAYNPAAPAAPEPVTYREKTPPPPDDGSGTGLQAAAKYDSVPQQPQYASTPAAYQSSAQTTPQAAYFSGGGGGLQTSFAGPPSGCRRQTYSSQVLAVYHLRRHNLLLHRRVRLHLDLWQLARSDLHHHLPIRPPSDSRHLDHQSHSTLPIIRRHNMSTTQGRLDSISNHPHLQHLQHTQVTRQCNLLECHLHQGNSKRPLAAIVTTHTLPHSSQAWGNTASMGHILVTYTRRRIGQRNLRIPPTVLPRSREHKRVRMVVCRARTASCRRMLGKWRAKSANCSASSISCTRVSCPVTHLLPNQLLSKHRTSPVLF